MPAQAIGEILFKIGKRLLEKLTTSVPDLHEEQVTEADPAPILGEAKAKMEAVGISHLTEVGSLSLDRNLDIQEAGLLASEDVTLSEGRSVDVRGTRRNMVMARVTDWPQTESVIIADELDLNDKRITIDRDRVSHLWIIARRIKARQGAVITYEEQEQEEEGHGPKDARPNPGQPDHDPTAPQNAGDAADGGDGGSGGHGGQGPDGLDSPNLTIVALDMDAMPDIKLPGQKGGRGGRGGRGADGGDGQRGRSSSSRGLYCRRSVGHGGDGGDGGDGGRGGKGGRGGDGADVVIATQAEKLDSVVGERPFTLDISGGRGGEAGRQGKPGEGGRGGKAGERRSRPCRRHSGRTGDSGNRGRSRGDKGPGDKGSSGTVQYTHITEDDWNRKLEQPWVNSLQPSEGFAGDDVTVKGVHFVEGAHVLLDDEPVDTRFNHAGQVAFTVPADVAGGERAVRVEVPDGETSNEAPLTIKPRLDEVRIAGDTVDTVGRGDVLTLVGSSFQTKATILRNGQPLKTASVSSSTEIELEIPEEKGEDAGGAERYVVQNPDGNESNELELKRLPSLDSGFRPSLHGYPFQNFSDGDATWGAFRETFGTKHISRRMVTSPARVGIVYAVFREFLDGYGLCSGMAATSLLRFHQDMDEIFHDYPSDVGQSNPADPPNIPDDLYRDITVAQGRVLSQELVGHYADQAAEGTIRVERTLRDIEEDFQRGLGVNEARVLCYVPSGSVWDIISDPEVREAFLESHCVTPTRLVYGDENKSLDGARLYIYENNRPGQDDLYIEFFMEDGELHFYAPYSDTPSSGITYSTDDAFTLGTAPLKKQLLKSVSMPSASGMVAEFILSPALVSIEDENGRVLGYKDGKMHSDPDLGVVCPWLQNYILVREKDGEPLRRTITGLDDGTYTYMSAHPDGRSLTIKDASCSRSTRDEVRYARNMEDVEIKVSESKTLELHIGEDEDDEETIRHLCVRCALEADEVANVKVTHGMDGLEVATPQRELNVDLELRRVQGEDVLAEKTFRSTVPADRRVVLDPGLWQDLEQAEAEVR